jgi:hypothetical protein
LAESLRVVPTGSRAALQPAAGWIQWFARLGFASRGIVYIIMGWLAIQLARGLSGSNADTSGAFRSLLHAPLGRMLLAVIAAGLACYTLWRLYAAVANPERDGIGKRLHHVWIAIVHIVLTAAAARMAWTNGSGGQSGDQDTIAWTSRAMSLPVGRWIVIGTGIGLALYGIYQLYRAAKADLDDMLDLSDLEPKRRLLLRRISRFGLAARGIVFILIGVFVSKAGWEYDATEARGFSGSLEAMRGAPYGPWLLGIIAFGIASYGVYSLVRARYRIVRTH